MENTKPSIYQNFFTIENGRTVLYVKFQKAFYRCLRSVLPFYENMVSDLISRGFIINTYDICISKMMVNGKHMTIKWHVDELKILHVDVYEVTKVIDWMKGIYSIHMKESHGKKKLPLNRH